jgi:hypothetical protein
MDENLRNEFIANASDIQDFQVRVAPQVFAQPGNIHIHGASREKNVIVPELPQAGAAVEHPVAVLGQE